MQVRDAVSPELGTLCGYDYFLWYPWAGNQGATSLQAWLTGRGESLAGGSSSGLPCALGLAGSPERQPGTRRVRPRGDSHQQCHGTHIR